MEIRLSFKINPNLYLKDPERSELGKMLIIKAIDLINQLGYEHFTFKKLALDIQTTEATIYRYFENKQKLLLYILNWYWSYLEFCLDYKITPIQSPEERLKEVISLLTGKLVLEIGEIPFNIHHLNLIVISESSKVYLVKEVTEINKIQLYKPYKDLCAKIANIIADYDPNYNFPKSLASSLIETAHAQRYFSVHLKGLTDVANYKGNHYVEEFLENLLFSVLRK